MENDLLVQLTEFYESKGYSGREAVEKAEAELRRRDRSQGVSMSKNIWPLELDSFLSYIVSTFSSLNKSPPQKSSTALPLNTQYTSQYISSDTEHIATDAENLGLQHCSQNGTSLEKSKPINKLRNRKKVQIVP
jgi:hypothetical protein